MTSKNRKSSPTLPATINRLENMIFTGVYQPRERLVVEDLAQRLKVSRYLIRNALIALESKGLVKTIPNKGAMVSDLAEEVVLEIFEVRVWLEIKANRLACKNLSPNDLVQLKSINEKIIADYRDNQLDKVIYGNQAFHNYIAKLSQNNTLVRMIMELKTRCHIFNSVAWSSPEIVEQLFEEHHLYLVGLERKDHNLLDELPERHFGHARDLFLNSLRAKRGSQIDIPK